MCIGVLEIVTITILCGQCLAWMFVFTVCEPGVLRGQKKAWDALEPEWQIVVSCYMCAENQTQVLWQLQ